MNSREYKIQKALGTLPQFYVQFCQVDDLPMSTALGGVEVMATDPWDAVKIAYAHNQMRVFSCGSSLRQIFLSESKFEIIVNIYCISYNIPVIRGYLGNFIDSNGNLQGARSAHAFFYIWDTIDPQDYQLLMPKFARKWL